MGSIGSGGAYLTSERISDILNKGQTKRGLGRISGGVLPDRLFIDDDRMIGSGTSKGVVSLHFYVRERGADGKMHEYRATQEQRRAILSRINSKNFLNQYRNKLDKEYNTAYKNAKMAGLSESQAVNMAHRANQRFAQNYINAVIQKEQERYNEKASKSGKKAPKLYARATYRRVIDERNT